MWRDSVGVVDRDIVIDGELSIQLHPFDEQRDIVELVRLEMLKHMGEPPKLVPM